MWLPPFLPCCVVHSDPHCIYILCILGLPCLLEIVNSDGMLSGCCLHSAPAPWGWVCVCAKESVWQVSVTSWPCFLSGIVGMCSLVAAAATVHLIVFAHITWTPHRLHTEKHSVKIYVFSMKLSVFSLFIHCLSKIHQIGAHHKTAMWPGRLTLPLSYSIFPVCLHEL